MDEGVTAELEGAAALSVEGVDAAGFRVEAEDLRQLPRFAGEDGPGPGAILGAQRGTGSRAERQLITGCAGATFPQIFIEINALMSVIP